MDMKSLNIPHVFANQLGIIPKFNFKEPNNQLLSDFLRGIFYIIIFILIISYSLYGKLYEYGKDTHILALCLYTLSELFTVFMNIFCIYKLNIRDGYKLENFLIKLQKLEIFITKPSEVKKANNREVMQFYVLQIMCVIFGCLSGCIYTNTLGWKIYKYSIMREFQNSHFMLLMSVMIHYTELIRMRMKDLNEHLQNYVKHNYICDMFETNVHRTPPKINFSIKKISASYTIITELINEYNDLFGCICVIFCVNMVLNILVPVNMVLLFIRGIPVHLKLSSETIGAPFIGFCIFWIIIPCVSRLFNFIS